MTELKTLKGLINEAEEKELEQQRALELERIRRDNEEAEVNRQEQVVSKNLEIQVQNKIAEEYPTLSDAKKAELAAEGVKEALSAQQNQEAIATLAEEYKESYKDPEGIQYLYEIDPYFFYGLSQQTDLSGDPAAHNFLPFFVLSWCFFLEPCFGMRKLVLLQRFFFLFNLSFCSLVLLVLQIPTC